MPFNLTIQLRSSAIKSFLLYLTVIFNILGRLDIVKKLVNKSNRLVKFTVLRSPHVNKIAQQHFGFKFYKKTLQILVQDICKFILWTKIFKNQLFTDVSLSIIYTINIKLIFIASLVIYFNKKLSKFLNFLYSITVKILIKASNLMV